MCGITIWLLYVTRIAVLCLLERYLVQFVTKPPSFRVILLPPTSGLWMQRIPTKDGTCVIGLYYFISLKTTVLMFNWRVTWNVKLSLPAEVIGCDGSSENFYGVDEENYCAPWRYSTQSETFMFGEAWCLFLRDRRMLGNTGKSWKFIEILAFRGLV